MKLSLAESIENFENGLARFNKIGLWDSYKGVFKTRFRLALDYTLTSNRTKKEDILTTYSNKWTGSVNPSQFWRKKECVSDNIMDPYRD